MATLCQPLRYLRIEITEEYHVLMDTDDRDIITREFAEFAQCAESLWRQYLK